MDDDEVDEARQGPGDLPHGEERKRDDKPLAPSPPPLSALPGVLSDMDEHLKRVESVSSSELPSSDVDEERRELLPLGGPEVPVTSWRQQLCSTLMAWLLLYVALSALTLLLYKKASELMPTYVMVLDMVQPMLLVPLLLGIQLVRLWLGKVSLPRLDPWSLAIYSGQAVLAAIMVLGKRYGSRGDLVSGPVGVVCSVFDVPCNMAMSLVFLGKRFRALHYIGVVVILGAVPISLIPSFEEGIGRSDGLALTVLVLSSVPLGALGVWNEWLLRRDRAELGWLLLFVALIHAVLCVPMFGLLPVVQTGVDFSWTSIWGNTQQGFQCFFAGIDVPNKPDQCSYVLYWFLGYEVVLTGQVLVGLWLTQRVSAALVAVGAAGAIPIASLLFIIPVFGGFPFSVWMLLSVLLVFVGMVCYRWRAEGVRSGSSNASIQ